MSDRIIVTRRSDDYHACIVAEDSLNQSGEWECGSTVESAVHRLWQTYPYSQGLFIEFSMPIDPAAEVLPPLYREGPTQS